MWYLLIHGALHYIQITFVYGPEWDYVLCKLIKKISKLKNDFYKIVNPNHSKHSALYQMQLIM